MLSVILVSTLVAAPIPLLPEDFSNQATEVRFGCVEESDDACATELALAIASGVGVKAIAVGPMVYLGQAETPSDIPELKEAPGLVSELIQAIKDKNWQMVVALAILLLVMLVNYVLFKLNLLTDEVRKAALPWIAAVSGCLLLFSSTLIAGGSWLEATIAGFATGAVAVGLWEMVIKRILKALKKKQKKKPPPLGG